MKTILLIAVVFGSIVVFWFGVRVALGTEYPLLTVASASMVPTLNVGDLIVVHGISDVSELKAAPEPEGDIIVFWSPRVEGELIVHRAINKTVGPDDLWYIKTQGDNNSVPDIWTGPDTWNNMISENLLVGKVVGRAQWLGYIPLYIRTPIGMVLLIVLILIIIFAEYIPISSKKQETAKD